MVLNRGSVTFLRVISGELAEVLSVLCKKVSEPRHIWHSQNSIVYIIVNWRLTVKKCNEVCVKACQLN